jgi:flagellar hook-associated protein 3 FlgL
MRVTEHTNFDLVRENVRRSKERMEGLQRQNATLKKLNAPSDDPIGAAKVLEIRTDRVNNDQFINNARLAETFLSNTDQALSELSDLVVRAKEIAIGQSSGASANDDTRKGLSEEVKQLFLQAVSTGNRRIGERYLFGGYKVHQPPIDQDGNFRGDSGKMMVEVSNGVFIPMNVSGTEVLGVRETPTTPEGQSAGGPNRSLALDESTAGTGEEVGSNVFEELQRLRISLLTGDIEAVRGTLEGLDEVHSQLVAARAMVGSRLQGLQTSVQSLERQNLTQANLSSAYEDADMAQVVSDLAKEETIFRSSLTSSQKLIQPTLMEFLR